MSDGQLKLLSPAKLNLFLLITGQRANGYHELQTLFQLLDHGDEISLKLREDSDIRLIDSIEGVADEDNLLFRAAMALREASGCQLGADIGIDKVLPMGGGIGGGSSNAATVLLGLNHLWGTQLSLDQLAELGLALGADVPVFVRGRTAWAEGVGEFLEPLNTEEKTYLVLRPDCSISTAEIFSDQQLTRNSRAITIAAFFEQGSRNDCETVARKLHPKLDKALIWLNNFTSAKMTGTGSCVFGEFDSQAEAEAVLAKIPADTTGFVARGINQSPVHRALGYPLT